MKKEIYPFLKDARAINEIRTHKWLESEKAGTEIGFATAALDWIVRYGEAWKAIHAKDQSEYAVLLERRRFRRFKLSTVVDLVKNGITHTAQVIDVSILGVLCRTQKIFTLGDRLEVLLSIVTPQPCRIACRGSIERAYPMGMAECQVFLRFDELGQRQIEQCAAFLTTPRTL